MERIETLKSIGFSDKFLEAIKKFDSAVPDIHYVGINQEHDHTFTVVDSSENVIVKYINRDYVDSITLTK